MNNDGKTKTTQLHVQLALLKIIRPKSHDCDT